MTTTEIGNILEDYLQGQFNNTVKTRGSGSVRGDGDLHGIKFAIEAKATTKNSMNIPLSIWDKIVIEAQREDKYPLLIEAYVDEDTKKVKNTMVRVNLDYLKYVLQPGGIYTEQLIDKVKEKLDSQDISDDIIDLIEETIWNASKETQL